SRCARATSASVARMRSAYGRAASIAPCARRSFAPATIRIARVICCVLRTVVMRRLMSFRLGTSGGLAGRSPAGHEYARERVERHGELALRVVFELAGGADRLEHVGMARAHELEHLLLVARYVVELERPHPGRARIRRGAGEDRHHLLFHRHRRVL